MEKFKDIYKNKIVKNLNDKFKYSNPMSIPKLEKICLNMGVGDAVLDTKVINNAVNDLALISGQKPVITYAKKSNAAFKIRKGMAIGCKVTLRKDRMYEFIERLILMALPRSRDFRGFSQKNFDGNGNFSFGIQEQIIFPEIDYDKVDKIRGLDVNIVTTANSNKEAKELLEGFFIPFVK